MSYSVLLTRMEVEMQSRLVHTDTKISKKITIFAPKIFQAKAFILFHFHFKMLKNIFEQENWICRTVYKGLESLFPGRSSP